MEGLGGVWILLLPMWIITHGIIEDSVSATFLGTVTKYFTE